MRLAGAIFAAALCGAMPVLGETIVSAQYSDPTDRYDHGILGDAIEHATLQLKLQSGKRVRIELPRTRVFEDTEPRLADVNGDGKPEVIVVETDIAKGARLSVYDHSGLIAATPYIGRTHRWLAPAGAADFDGDGRVEIAYVDRPHLAKTLLVWRLEDGKLRRVATLDSVTNHRIGDPIISGGVRTCQQGPEMIMASGDWRRIVRVHWTQAGHFEMADMGPNQGPHSFDDALNCPQ